MALPAPLQALFDRLQAYNNGPYNAQSNPLGLARGGNQNPVANFLSSLKDFSAFGKGISDLTSAATGSADAAAASAALAAEDAENTRLDRIATAESVGLAADEVGKATAQANRSRDEADRAQNYADGLNLPPIAAAQARQVLAVKPDGSGFELVRPNRLSPERLSQLSW